MNSRHDPLIEPSYCSRGLQRYAGVEFIRNPSGSLPGERHNTSVETAENHGTTICFNSSYENVTKTLATYDMDLGDLLHRLRQL